MDGISRGYNLYYRESDYEDSDISTYSTDAYGAGINFGYPINEITRLNFGTAVEDLTIKTYNDTASEIKRYVDEQGADAQALKLTASWTRNNLNRGIMPTDGSYQRLSLETAVPGSDAEYAKLRAQARQLFALDDNHDWALKFSGELGYADTLGGSDPYPFYENFYAGGLGSVRGFTGNTLGQPTTPSGNSTRDRTLGGNMLVQGSAELIFPTPFVGDQRTVQSSLFVDGGNTFLSDCYPVLDADATGQLRLGSRLRRPALQRRPGALLADPGRPADVQCRRAAQRRERRRYPVLPVLPRPDLLTGPRHPRYLAAAGGGPTGVYHHAKLTAAFALLLMSAIALPALAADVAVLDWRRALMETDVAQRSMSELENRVGSQQQQAQALEQELNQLQQRADSLSDSERQQANQKVAELNRLMGEVMQARQESEQALLQRAEPKLQQAVEQIIARHSIQVLVEPQGVLHAERDLQNVTAEVTEILNSML